jgi:hypothetical protein
MEKIMPNSMNDQLSGKICSIALPARAIAGGCQFKSISL